MKHLLIAVRTLPIGIFISLVGVGLAALFATPVLVVLSVLLVAGAIASYVASVGAELESIVYWAITACCVYVLLGIWGYVLLQTDALEGFREMIFR